MERAQKRQKKKRAVNAETHAGRYQKAHRGISVQQSLTITLEDYMNMDDEKDSMEHRICERANQGDVGCIGGEPPT